MWLRVVLYGCCLCIAFLMQYTAIAQQRDSVLAEVKVSAAKSYSNITSPLPVQILNRRDLDQMNAINIADAAKFFSGVLVKDYGGIGGLKTISVRSLGAAHTGIFYDGILLNDAQAGQIDLGKYRVENIAQIRLYNAQPADILNTARAFSAASVLMLETNAAAGEPHLVNNKLSAGINSGSFGLIQPFVAGAITQSPRWRLYGDAGYLRAKNDYPFRDYENANATMRRLNSDIRTFSGEANLVYENDNKSRFLVKSYFYDSERGLPNGIILYNRFSNERLGNKDFFVQSSYRKNMGERMDILLNGKYSYQFFQYTRPPALATDNLYENIFHQYEYYISGAVRRRLSNLFSASYATDFFYTKLNRTDEFINQSGFVFAYPSRNTFLNNIALKAAWQRAELQFSLLHTITENKAENGEHGKNLQRFSPTISGTIQPLFQVPLRIRAFYKNVFRVPAFNDLYYTMIGNTNLRPEIADQFNIGLSYLLTQSRVLQRASINADFYHNSVKDKIVATPRENLFQWSMQNLGIVKINGVDISAETVFQNVNHFVFSLNGNYTYQRAIDKTDPQSALYNNQIAYTPEHSGSLRMGTGYKNFSVGYSILFSSYRFRIGELLESNYLPAWSVSDINLRYRIRNNKNIFSAFVEANNIFNKQYDIVMYYPMPGTHFRAGIKIERNSN